MKYTILKNGNPVAHAEDMETAVSLVRSLESSLNRLTEQSPYTIQSNGN